MATQDEGALTEDGTHNRGVGGEFIVGPHRHGVFVIHVTGVIKGGRPVCYQIHQDNARYQLGFYLSPVVPLVVPGDEVVKGVVDQRQVPEV